MRKSILFATFTLKIIVLCFCASGNSSFKSLKFTFVCSKRIDTGFRTAAVKSAIGCCSECMGDGRCAAVSVNAAAGVCWLLDVYPDDCSNDNVSTDASWSVYAKPGCDSGWSFYRGWCYKLLELPKASWLGAERKCSKLGATLVKIEDQAEYDFIKNSAMTMWGSSGALLAIGLYDHDNDGTFAWLLDGSTPTFTKWIPGQPNNYDNQDCVFMNSIGWFDTYCETVIENLSAVCEKQLYP